MKNNLQNTSGLEEKKIDWKTIQNVMKEKFGSDIFDSWLKKIELIDEYKNYILISVSTRFIRDWITSRYLDQILQIVKSYKKEIIRIEFLVDDKKNSNNIETSNTDLNSKSEADIGNNVSFIKDSYLQYNRIDPNKNFNNFITGQSNKLAFEASKKKDGVPVDERVAAHFLAIIPLFPTPEIINLPFKPSILFTALKKSSLRLFAKSFIAFDSTVKTSFADLRICNLFIIYFLKFNINNINYFFSRILKVYSYFIAYD